MYATYACIVDNILGFLAHQDELLVQLFDSSNGLSRSMMTLLEGRVVEGNHTTASVSVDVNMCVCGLVVINKMKKTFWVSPYFLDQGMAEFQSHGSSFNELVLYPFI